MLANYGRCTRPSVGGFFYSRQGEPTWAHGILSCGVTTVSPCLYIRGRPHAALSGVGGPRERPAFPAETRGRDACDDRIPGTAVIMPPLLVQRELTIQFAQPESKLQPIFQLRIARKTHFA
jgi:hypothetical protein